MLELIFKNFFVLFHLIHSHGYRGIEMTPGRRTRSGVSAQRTEIAWVETTQDEPVIREAAIRIRRYLDKGFYWDRYEQLSLFDAEEMKDSLFAEEAPDIHPVLARAYERALTLPPGIRWKPCTLAAPLPCHRCGALIEMHTIANIATQVTPTGPVLHLHCRDCHEKSLGHFA